MYLIKNQNNHHVSSDTTNEFEEIMLADTLVKEVGSVSPLIFNGVFILYRLAKKCGFSTILPTKKQYQKCPLEDDKHLFTIMMGLDEIKYKPFGFTTNHCRSIFLFDAWEKDYNGIVQFLEKYKIDFVFVTASQSARNLRTLLAKTKVFWIPEAIKKEEYRFKEYAEKKQMCWQSDENTTNIIIK
ncbi:MAG: hypothetical protein QM751_01270 [Paludibacteraceae bacterium]